MSLVHALFVPKGTITKSAFGISAAILIGIGVVNSFITSTVPALGPVIFFLGLVVAYCWVALWIKRFQAAGTSGWWTVLVVFVWLILSFIAGFAALALAGLDFSVFASGNQAAIQAAMEEATAGATIFNLLAGALVSGVVAFGLNAILPAGRYQGETVPQTGGGDADSE